MNQFFALLVAACAIASVQGRALQQAAAAAPTTVAEALAATPSLSTLNAAVQVNHTMSFDGHSLANEAWVYFVLDSRCLAALLLVTSSICSTGTAVETAKLDVCLH
jgi:hypothetical protein